MPSAYSRIAVVRDPKLDAALKRAAPLLKTKSAAGLVRELALRGADAVEVEAKKTEMDPVIRDLMERFGADPATESWAEFIEGLAFGPVDPDNPTPGTDALQEMREDRI
jgi:hypothetical protein